ncbi:MAG: bifunctional diguanylate cyclase/phosphodiesterase [Geminicoccaceae bacterium]|nr:bifunctional diguanylate cyclase/phosphodiesterase [Geminicoccaceae bacterium]
MTMIETAKAQLPASAEGLLDENEAIWRRNYLAYGIVFMLLAVGALMLALGLRLQTRLLSISEVTVEELSILRGISDRFDYLFDQGTMEPITVDLITKVINENNRQLDRLLALNERIRKDKQVISRYGSITNILSNESGDLLKLLREHEKHFRSYASYLKMMEFQSGKDPQRFFDTHEHFIAMKMPQLLTTQNRLTEKLQANISEQQSTLMIGFTVMVGGIFSGLTMIWYLVFLPLRRQIEINRKAIRNQHMQLAYLAHWDRLTKLGNRHLFHQTLDSLVASRKRCSLALIDVDRFKSINDSFGHLHGDGALVAIGQRMSEAAAGDAHIFRLGGDEFAVVFDHLWEARSIHRTLENILLACREAIEFPDMTLNLSVSIGLASSTGNTPGAESLLAAADKALYHAKLHGGDQLACYDELFDRSITHYISFDQQLIDAVRLERFKAFYQPIVCLKSGRVRRLEALARLVGADGKLLAPGAWIADAERLGLMSRISWRMLEIIKSDAPRLRRAFPDLESIALNVTGVMLADGRLEQEIISSRTENGHSWLSIELTEGCMIERGSGNIHHHLQRLSDAGGVISLDDFGTGFASLAHLQQIPFDMIKIDRRFVADIDSDAGNRVIIEGMIKLAHGLGKQVVCEGIETRPVLNILTDLGCEFGQGYHFSRPQPLERLISHCLQRFERRAQHTAEVVPFKVQQGRTA